MSNEKNTDWISAIFKRSNVTTEKREITKEVTKVNVVPKSIKANVVPRNMKASERALMRATDKVVTMNMEDIKEMAKLSDEQVKEYSEKTEIAYRGILNDKKS